MQPTWLKGRNLLSSSTIAANFMCFLMAAVDEEVMLFFLRPAKENMKDKAGLKKSMKHKVTSHRHA